MGNGKKYRHQVTSAQVTPASVHSEEGLPRLDTLRIRIDHLGEDGFVNIMLPHYKWNKAILVSPEDNLMADFVGVHAAKRILEDNRLRWFTTSFWIMGFFSFFIGLYLDNGDSYIVCGVLCCSPGAILCLLSLNKLLFSRLVQTFEFVWLTSLCISFCLVFSWTMLKTSHIVEAIATPLMYIPSKTFAIGIDAAHPVFKPQLKLALLPTVFLFYPFILFVVSFQTLHGLESFDFTVKLSDDMAYSLNNIELLSRNLAVLWLFSAKIYFKLVVHPGDSVLLKCSMNTMQMPVKDLKSNLEQVQRNYRVSRLDNLRDGHEAK